VYYVTDIVKAGVIRGIEVTPTRLVGLAADVVAETGVRQALHKWSVQLRRDVVPAVRGEHVGDSVGGSELTHWCLQVNDRLVR